MVSMNLRLRSVKMGRADTSIATTIDGQAGLDAIARKSVIELGAVIRATEALPLLRPEPLVVAPADAPSGGQSHKLRAG
jgi:hypothetical protein